MSKYRCPSAPHTAASTLSIDSVLGDPEIDALSRSLRMQVYETFRSERVEYDKRRRAATQVVQGWMRSGQQESARGVVLNWLRGAIVASRPGSAAGLPEIPTFANHLNAAEQTLDMAVRPVPDAIVGHRAQPDHRPQEHDATDPSVSIRRVPPSDVGDLSAVNRPRIFGSLGRAVYRAVSSPPATEGESVSSPDIVPSAGAALSAADDEQNSVSDDDQIESKSPVGKDVETGVESQAGEDDELEIEVEIEIDPASSVSASMEPQVNLPDLEARVYGYNLALQALEDGLREEGVWTATRLTPIIDELAELADRRRVLDLYGDLLPEETSHLVDRLNSADFAMELAKQRIEDARASIRSGETSSEPRQRQEQLQELDAFARQLADLATNP